MTLGFHKNKSWLPYLAAVSGAFITYFSMYAFRKPFTASTYGDLELWGVDYKIILVITQVVGYTLSKFIGIKVVSELKPGRRILYVLSLISVAWIALLFFGLIPYPYNFICLFFNGLPLGMIWGIVFAFLEGRKQTELLAAGMASSFIVASGFVKTVGNKLILDGVNEFWMPFLTGAIFIPSLLIGLWLLSKVPPPSEEDESKRIKRLPMSKSERKAFFLTFAPGIVLVTMIYMALNAFRDFRDNFAVDLWKGLGYAEAPEIMTKSEIPIAIAVLLIAGTMIFVRSNRIGFFMNMYVIALGGAIALATTYLFQQGSLDPAAWMIAVGFAMYLPYMFYHTMFLERWIALFRYTSNIGFLMYICDSFGYLGSVAVMLYKDFFFKELSWVNFFVKISYGMGFVALGLSVLAYIYFKWKYKKVKNVLT